MEGKSLGHRVCDAYQGTWQMRVSIYEKYSDTANAELAFLMLCDQAVIPPFLRGKMIELDKFFFVSKMFELNLSYFRESGTVEVNFQRRILKFREENTW